MKRREILETTIPNSAITRMEQMWNEDYLRNGRSVTAMFEEIARVYGRNVALHVLSRTIERLELEAMVIQDLDDREILVTARRNNNNDPEVTRINRSRGGNETYNAAILAQAQKGFLPNYFESLWLDTYEENQDNPRYQAALASRNRRDGTTVTYPGGPEPAEPAGAETFPVPPPNVTARPLDQPPSSVDPAPQPAPAAAPPAGGGESALEIFANSGKGGLRNDRDEVEAIIELQTFLVGLGLDTGGVGNGYGPKTREAVRKFQSAFVDVVQDGDAGPETIGKIVEVRRDIERIEALVNAIQAANVTDSVIPIRFKSGLAQLLERELTQEERTELQRLLTKYETFRQEFPNFQQNLFQRAEAVVQTPAAQTPSPAAPNGPFLDGMVITPAIQERLRTIGRDPGINGERLTPEDIAALNAAIADGRITNPIGAAEPPAAEPPAAAPDQSDAETQRLAAAGQSAAATYGADFTTNIRTYLRTDRSPDETRRLLAALNLSNLNTEELQRINRMLTNLSLKLARGDRNYVVDGQRITVEGGPRAESAEVVRNYVNTTLRQAMQRTTPAAPATGNANEKARNLFDLLSGWTSRSEQQRVVSIIQTISTREEYNQVNTQFRRIARNEDLQHYISMEIGFNTTAIRQHLQSIGVPVTLPESVSNMLNRLNKVLGVKQ